MKSQSGFTLIELVIVIVLLGVLAAIAVPRFVNLQDDALIAQRNATAASITSAMNINFAECALNNHVPAAGGCLVVSACDLTTVNSVLQNPLVGYTITAGTPPLAAGDPRGTARTCNLVQTATGQSAPFTAIRAGT